MTPISAAKKKLSSWRFAAYFLILVYLICDLYVFQGPLKQKINNERSRFENAPDKSEWVAMVNREPITKRQLEVAVVEHLFRRGQVVDDLSPQNLKITRLAVLNDLVSETVVRQYAEGEDFKADPEAVSKFIEAFESQFESEADLQARTELQQLDEESRREKLAKVLGQKAWIESRIGKAIDVTEAEARAWYEENSEEGTGFTNPERFHARHIFISTVIESGPEREALIRKLHEHLTNEDGDFAAVVAEFSEDERTKKSGGDLNWFTKNRMPEDFFKAVSKLQPGEMSEPFKTKIGWHIVEMIDRKPAEKLSFETLKPEIMAHLESVQRNERVQELLMRFRKAARIEMFPDAL